MYPGQSISESIFLLGKRKLFFLWLSVSEKFFLFWQSFVMNMNESGIDELQRQ